MTTIVALKNHAGMSLEAQAAASLERFEEKYGLIGINSAWRSQASQDELNCRWAEGGKFNRPPYLYQPAKVSDHTAGLCIDTSEFLRFVRDGSNYGWKRTAASSDPVHFKYFPELDLYRGGAAGPAAGDQVTKDQQNFLISRGYDLGLAGADGIRGPKYKAAVESYQTYLMSRGWYFGSIDGNWQGQTQEAHAKFWAELNPPQLVTLNKTAAKLPWHGIQEMLKALYGYTGIIDGIPGPRTIGAFQRFLNAGGFAAGAVDETWGPSTGKAAQRWLKARWGYKGLIDNDFGSGTVAAWTAANTANGKAY